MPINNSVQNVRRAPSWERPTSSGRTRKEAASDTFEAGLSAGDRASAAAAQQLRQQALQAAGGEKQQRPHLKAPEVPAADFAGQFAQWAGRDSTPQPLRSRIEEHPGLQRAAEQAGQNQAVQREMTHLVAQFNAGNRNPGIGSRTFGPITELRGRNGGRVYLRMGENGQEIVAKSSKANQTQVWNLLQRLYDLK